MSFLVLRWAASNRKQIKRNIFQRLKRVTTKCSTEKLESNARPQTEMSMGSGNEDDFDENDKEGSGDETAR